MSAFFLSGVFYTVFRTREYPLAAETEDGNAPPEKLNWMLTLRGIPKIYHSTEILMKNFKSPTDAEVRLDFPGGWPGDAVNKFTPTGRSALENNAYQYIRTLAQFRKSSSVLTTDKTMQYVVRDGVYICFRCDDRQIVMVITNTGKIQFRAGWPFYKERISGFSRASNIVTRQEFMLSDLTVPPGVSWVMELKK